jgi:multicomponent Na+:H+ antiporter subunit B
MRDALILRLVAKFLIPVILLFGLYVQFHGEIGPGGAFQAGVIIASAFIVHMLAFGLEATRAVAPIGVLRAIAACGVLLYGSVGIAGLLLGGNYLEYNVLGTSPTAVQHAGIILIELGVALTVASTMILLVFTFAERVDG